MKEKVIETKLVKKIKATGGLALKLSCPGFDGMPDRLVLLPGGVIAFVELKAPSKKPRPLQLARHKLLRGLGFPVYIIDDEPQIEMLLTKIGGDAK